MNFKTINIGALIRQCVADREIDMFRICSFFNCDEENILEMYNKNDFATGLVLKWSKLLEYDFFRLYTQHLILYSPSSVGNQKKYSLKSSLSKFWKNIYTKEVINFILQQILTREMTRVIILVRE